MATIHDVAREAGVSISTVSYALNGKRAITAATRQRVEAAALKLNYRPNAGARMMGGTKSHIFALTAPLRADTSASAHMAFVLAVTTAARRFDYDVLLLVEDDAMNGLERVARSRLADAVILLDVARDDERVTLVRGLPLPSVVIGVPDDTEGLTCVDLDFEAAGTLAVQRLAEFGHRHIGLIGQHEETYSRGANFPQRFLGGFNAACEERGIENRFAHSSDNETVMRQEIGAVVDGPNPPSALVLNCDLTAHKLALKVLAERGLVVGQDIAVLSACSSFDTTEFDSPLDVIPLKPSDSCERAVELAIAHLSTPGEPHVELIAPTYVAHGSVRPVKR